MVDKILFGISAVGRFGQRGSSNGRKKAGVETQRKFSFSLPELPCIWNCRKKGQPCGGGHGKWCDYGLKCYTLDWNPNYAVCDKPR
ncbi:unnamed protein product [Caenorhabditis auriculariae]|uniref:Uncharacterized protein n=1 Tax=Caenorhabditis auriculariae TaxID=2777116 RepID=A0A8S1H3Z9_9PELO|nr:unnamed protein product [Caenorhabditis auriculariae]